MCTDTPLSLKLLGKTDHGSRPRNGGHLAPPKRPTVTPTHSPPPLGHWCCPDCHTAALQYLHWHSPALTDTGKKESSQLLSWSSGHLASPRQGASTHLYPHFSPSLATGAIDCHIATHSIYTDTPLFLQPPGRRTDRSSSSGSGGHFATPQQIPVAP